MRINTLIIIILSILFSVACSKEDDSSTELKITYLKSEPDEKSVYSPNNGTTITYYPNPFTDKITFNKSGNEEIIVFIADGKGKFKEINITDQSFILDFSEEEEGAYYMEIKIKEQVIRDHLIKFDS